MTLMWAYRKYSRRIKLHILRYNSNGNFSERTIVKKLDIDTADTCKTKIVNWFDWRNQEHKYYHGLGFIYNIFIHDTEFNRPNVFIPSLTFF
jgi:hypothetical protein